MQDIIDCKDQEQKHLLLPKVKISEALVENIFALTELLATPMFTELDVNEVHQDLNISIIKEKTIKGAVPVGIVPCNKALCEMIELVKPKIVNLIKDSNLLKTWICSKLKISEKGTNVYVSLKKTRVEVQAIEAEAVAYLDQISQYFLSRAKIISKLVEHPNIDDYRRAVVELDEKEYLSLQLVMSEMRNRYYLLLDLFTNKLKKLN